MSSRSRDKTGGNTEPMPFVRKFGAAAAAAAAAGEPTIEVPSKSEENNGNDFGLCGELYFLLMSF